MPSGLVALLDDVAGIAKLAAASLDDVGAAAGKAGAKAAGVVVDDTAVTPRYVMGLTPDRELPIIWKIALGSLRNKLLILLPAAMLLSAFLPWAITPLLMAGGAFLCFEATEKIIEVLSGHGGQQDAHVAQMSPEELEREQVSGAVRTDLILSAEIMAIALSDVAESPLLTQGLVLALVGVAITAGVYGVVALIVKMDDIGLALAKRPAATAQAIGRGLVRAMPKVMQFLSVVGTAAMLWVGGGIILHGLEVFGLEALPGAVHHAAVATADAIHVLHGAVEWLVTALGGALTGAIVGSVVVGIVHLVAKARGKPAH